MSIWSVAFNVHDSVLEIKNKQQRKNDILNLKTADLQIYLSTRKSIDEYWT